MDTERDADCARLAEAMGWTVGLRTLCGEIGFRRRDGDGIDIPAPDAPLPAQMEFVGKLAVEVQTGFGESDGLFSLSRLYDGWDDAGWLVVFRGQHGEDCSAEAPDLAHAAVRAALATRGGTNGTA